MKKVLKYFCFLLIMLMPIVVNAGMINSPSLGELLWILFKLAYPYILEISLFVSIITYLSWRCIKCKDEGAKKQLKNTKKTLLFLVFLAIVTYPVCLSIFSISAFVKIVYFIEIGFSLLLLIMNSNTEEKIVKEKKLNKRKLNKIEILLIILVILTLCSYFIYIAVATG